MPQIPSNPAAPPQGSRTAYVASRAVGGAVAAQVLNFLKTAVAYFPLSHAPPAISDHWAVLVGDTIYELQSPGGYVSYEKSEKSMLGGWQIYEMGYTFHSDGEIDSSGECQYDITSLCGS
ncbi:hypothetical protein FQN54_000835 [Arachnomyces sp. PD_36]|nr:hypothetical protein FQN54_000835 [Arachnomyces sp. PD_36]